MNSGKPNAYKLSTTTTTTTTLFLLVVSFTSIVGTETKEGVCSIQNLSVVKVP